MPNVERVDGLRLPRATTVLRYVDRDIYRATCACDWRSTVAWLDVERAVADAEDHARRDAWCYVHRNLTPTGADPVMEGDPNPVFDEADSRAAVPLSSRLHG